MIMLMKLYYKFVFSNHTILILLVFQLIVVFGLLQSSGILLGYFTLDMSRIEFEMTYIQEAINLIKTMIVILAIFVTMLLNSSSCHNLSKYLVDKPIVKVRVFYAKIGLLITTVLCNLLFFWIVMIWITCVFTPYEIALVEYIDVFFYLLLQSLFYITFTNLLLSILPNVFVSFIPIVLFWYMELNHSIWFSDEHNLARFLYNYIPNTIYVQDKFILFGSISNYGILICILLLGNSLYITKKDIL